jgi:hypothetical protein
MIYQFRDLSKEDKTVVLCHQANVVFCAFMKDWDEVKQHLTSSFIEEFETLRDRHGDKFSQDVFIDYLESNPEGPLNTMFKDMVQTSCREMLYTFDRDRSVLLNVDEHRNCDHDDGNDRFDIRKT